MNAAVDVRLAVPGDADELAVLLHDFNTEFDTASPGPSVLGARLRGLLAAPSTFAVLAGRPSVGFGLITLRPNVWFDGPVALLDELYVVPSRRDEGIGAALIAAMEAECRVRGVEYVEINVDEGDNDTRRFYERLGYSAVDPDSGEPALYYSRAL